MVLMTLSEAYFDGVYGFFLAVGRRKVQSELWLIIQRLRRFV